MNAKIKREINRFIADKKAKKVEIKVPKGFSLPLTPRVIFNKVIIAIQQKIPPYEWKLALMRLTGMNIQKRVCVPHDIKFDPYFPELITLRYGCLVGGASTYNTHKIEKGKLTLGRIEIAEKTLVAGLVTIDPGSYCAKDSILGINSRLEGDTGVGEFWGGKPARMIAKFKPEQIKQYSRPNPYRKTYYAQYKKKILEFRRNPKNRHINVKYAGKRVNAGNDWYKARNPIMIYLKGGIIEFTRLFPIGGFGVPFFRLLGTKIGKNVKIGKRMVVDHFFPEHLTIGNNVVIGDDAYMDGHEYTIAESIFAKTVIEDDVKIGDKAWIRTGITVGKGSVIEPGSMVMKDVPPGEVWGGSPAKFRKKLGE